MSVNKNECQHTNLSKELINGASTGDYICVDCGAIGWGKNWPENDRKQKLSEEKEDK